MKVIIILTLILFLVGCSQFTKPKVEFRDGIRLTSNF